MKRLGTAAVLVLIFSGLVVVPADAAPKFAISVVARAQLTGEPGVEIDNRTSPPTVYVVAPLDSTQLWRSPNGGKNFKKMAATTGSSGDSDVTVDKSGRVYASDLIDSGPVNLPVSTSGNGAKSYSRKVAAGDGGEAYDRQWTASKASGHLVMTATSDMLHSWVSTDAARSFDGPFDVSDLSGTAGPLIAGPSGVYYIPFTGSGLIGFAKSRDGKRWSDGIVARNHTAVLFPVMAMDDAWNLYMVWSEASGDLGIGTAPVYFSRSSNFGRTWTRPRNVSPTKPDAYGTIPSALFPWIVAGSKGRVGISYITARQAAGPDIASDLGGPQTSWDLVVVQSTNALSSKPSWSKTVVARTIHTGSVCTFGIACASPQNIGFGNYPGPFDRRLLDYFEAGVDRAGRMYIAFQKDRAMTAGTVDDLYRSQTDIMLARQVGGTRLRP
jgi:hypothetical protein